MGKFMKRERYLSRIRGFYDCDEIKVITGPRRSGKSCMMMTIAEEIKDRGVDDDHLIFIDLEDQKNRDLHDVNVLNDHLESVMTDGRYYIFIDEIQHVDGFESMLASIRKRDCSVFVTGSNSRLLSGELATLLVGRAIEFQVYPFTYSESIQYLDFIGKEVPVGFFNDYLRYGGYPQRFIRQTDDDVRDFLKTLFDTSVERDILQGRKRVDRDQFKRIASYILAYAGNEFSAYSVQKYLKKSGEDAAPLTIYKYVDWLDQAFLIRRVRKYDISGKKMMLKSEKQYSVDNGLRFVQTNGSDFAITFYLENMIYLELVSRGYEVYVGKLYNGEVDFVVRHGGGICYIQVAYLLASEETIEREFGAFRPIKDNHPKYVMSLDPIDMSRDGIVHLNIESFLLGRSDIGFR